MQIFFDINIDISDIRYTLWAA